MSAHDHHDEYGKTFVNYPRLVERLGPEAEVQRLESTSKKKVIVDGGELRPGHLRARKPA